MRAATIILLALCVVFTFAQNEESFFPSNEEEQLPAQSGNEEEQLPGQTGNEEESVHQSPQTCWLGSYGRGAGVPISTCGAGQEQNGALCYPLCESGYSGVGPVCWSDCPDGFTNTGVDCLKPSSYGRGAGYVDWELHDCLPHATYGCEKYGAMWYPRCAPGFNPAGCCVCSPDCPDGMTDIGVSCQRNTYGRGAGSPLSCAAGQDESGALCYPGCNEGYNGIGPVCWAASCPAGLSKCGALCTNSGACTSTILNMVFKTMEGVANIAGDTVDGDVVGGVVDTAQTAYDLYKGLNHPLCA